MVDPPLGDDVTKETREQYISERDGLLSSLKKRAKIVTKYLNQMDNIEAKEIQATFYSFPRIYFSSKAKAAAQ